MRFPSTDGDTIKGTYLLMTLPAAAVGAAFVLDTLRPAGRSWAVATLAVLAALWVVELRSWSSERGARRYPPTSR